MTWFRRAWIKLLWGQVGLENVERAQAVARLYDQWIKTFGDPRVPEVAARIEATARALTESASPQRYNVLPFPVEFQGEAAPAPRSLGPVQHPLTGATLVLPAQKGDPAADLTLVTARPLVLDAMTDEPLLMTNQAAWNKIPGWTLTATWGAAGPAYVTISDGKKNIGLPLAEIRLVDYSEWNRLRNKGYSMSTDLTGPTRQAWSKAADGQSQ